MSGIQQLLLAGATRILVNITVGAGSTYTANTAKVSGYIAGIMDVTFTISGALQANPGDTAALIVDTSWNTGDTVTIVNNAGLYGFGGHGGVGASGERNGSITVAAAVGVAGGDALNVQRNATVVNNSVVYGGGGGGGGGGLAGHDTGAGYYTVQCGSGGGGGAGNNGGVVGTGGTGGADVASGAPGTIGTTLGAGSGGAALTSGPPPTGGAGGNGGTWGTNGTSGANGVIFSGFDYVSTGAVRGLAGRAVIGKSFVNGGAGVSGTTAGTQV
jgi:hypothetical protein